MSDILENQCYRGPYLGFTYNGIHSSSFNIVRTSDGSRFNENLLPTIQDKSIQIPGRAGKVLQDSNFDTRVFTVQYAYDKMTEKDRANLKLWLGDKKIHALVFDELPYKTWFAKVTGTASAKWIPFDDEDEGRIYKGEGTIQFTCYDPFAYCPFNFQYMQYADRDEWIEGSRLLERDYRLCDGKIGNLGQWLSGDFFYLENEKEFVYKIYNCGDVECDFVIQMEFTNTKLPIPSFELQLTNEVGVVQEKLVFESFSLSSGDNKISINSKLNLCEGITTTTNKKSGTIYDGYITSGSYFKIPVGETFWLKIKRTDRKGWENINAKIDCLYKYL